MGDARTTRLRALVHLELRRAAPVARRAAVLGGGTLAVLWGTGAMTPGRGAFVLALMGTLVATTVPLAALRDRLDGSLDFLRSLPVTPGELVGGRFLAVVAAGIPGAMLCTAGALLASSATMPEMTRPGPALGLFAGVVALLSISGFWIVAALLRFEVGQLGLLPLGVMLSLLVVGRLLEGHLPEAADAVRWVLGHEELQPAWGSTAAALLALASWGAFVVARAGARRGGLTGERVTW